MQKYWKEIRVALVAGIGAFLLAILLPPRVTITAKALVEYALNSALQRPMLALGIFSGIGFLLLWRRAGPKSTGRSKQKPWGPLAVSSLLAVGITFLLALNQDLKIVRKLKPTCVFVGCYTVNSDGVLVEDSDARYLAEKSFAEIERNVRVHTAFKTHILNLERIYLPSFLPALFGQNYLEGYIRRRFERDGSISAIYGYRRSGSQRIEFKELHASVFEEHDAPFENSMQDDFSAISTDIDTNPLAVSAISGLYIGIMGQSVVEFLISERRFSDAHLVVDDSDAMIREALARSNANEKTKQLSDYWNANFARLRARLFDQQEQYAAAARQLLLAYDYYPYFPYRDYRELTLAWFKVYASEIKALYENGGRYTDAAGRDIVSDKILDWAFKPTGEWLRQLVARHPDNAELCRVVETGFRRLLEVRKDDPAVWIFWGDTVKMLPMGTRTDRGLFIDRIPESREAYQIARKLDPHFPLIPIKLGSLELFGVPEGDLKEYREAQSKRAIELMKDGSDLYLKYFGLDDGPKKISSEAKPPSMR